MVGDKRVVSLFRYPMGKVDLSHAGLIRLLEVDAAACVDSGAHVHDPTPPGRQRVL